MITCILAVNSVSVVASVEGGIKPTFTRLAGDVEGLAKPYRDKFLAKINYIHDGRDYEVWEIALDNNSSQTLLPGDLLILDDRANLSVVANPTDFLRDLILDNSGLEIICRNFSEYD